jgi:cell wall assembly regulator SMI1
MVTPPEGERRKPRPATLSFDDILAAFQRDQDRHMNSGPSTQAELGHVEAALGVALPQPLRAFLMRFGGGIFYNGHEIFGPMRCMVHDIELVPDVLSVRQRLKEEHGLADGLIPLHRARGVVHVIDLRSGAIARLDGGEPHPDLGAFLENVVMPRR